VALDYTTYESLTDLEYRNLVEIYHHSIDHFAEQKLFGVKRDGQYQWMSYADFGERVERCRAALASMGVEHGDTVAIISNNRPEWAIGAYATYTLGARWCPMYEAQAEKEWAYIINDSDAKIAFVANADIRQTLAEMCEAGDISLDHIVHFDGPREDSFDALLEGSEPNVEAVEPDGDDICGLIYTSGTTGDPKGVLLSHNNIASNVEAIHSFNIIAPDDISLSFLPWAHSFGQTAELHGMFATGASMGLVESISTITENLQEIRPTLLFSVPRIFNRIYNGIQTKLEEEGGLKKTLFEKALQNSDRLRNQQQQEGQAHTTTKLLDKFYDKLVFQKVRQRFGGRLKYAVSGGAKLSPEIAYFIDNMHISVMEGYGLTETSPIVSVNAPGQHKIGSVGKPVTGVEVKIEKHKEHESEFGEVCVRGPNIMKGYYKKPDKTAEVIDEDGWFHTGDLGCIDEDGFLWIEGRAKEEFKLSNGKYVSPGPLEEKLKLAPHVDQVMLEGHNHPFNVAIVNVDKEALQHWAEKNGVPTDNLTQRPEVRELIESEIEEQSADFKNYERPRKVIIVDDEWTPENGVLTPTLKLKRRVIYERYEDNIEDVYEDADED
jgi:long-chain acyl-CoA synthetase